MVYGLPRESFICPDVFQREQQTVFARRWICAGRVPEDRALDTEGLAYRLADVAGRSIILTRDASGTLRGWHNLCRHRGTRLIEQPVGTLKNDCITCPYHAWTYDAAGALIGAPNMQDVADFQRQEFGLLPVRCARWGGYVFVSLDANGETWDEFVAPLAERLANWSIGQLRVTNSLTYDVAANWKLLFQNYSECYHCPTVHPDLNQVTPYKTASNDLLTGPILGGPMSLADGFQTVTRDGRAIAEPFPGLDLVQQRSVCYYTVFPNWFVSAHPDYMLVHRIEPVTPWKTRVCCDILVASNTGDAAAEPAVEMWDEINRQDWRVCELTQAGVSSPDFRPGPYSNLEPMLVAFDNHYRSEMAQVSH